MKGLCSRADLDLTDSVHQCTLIGQPRVIAVLQLYLYFILVLVSSNNSMQCIYGGFIVYVVLVANVSAQKCESV